MKPFGGLGRLNLWRRHWLSAVVDVDVLPYPGSGIAAKQYDPGAPFFSAENQRLSLGSARWCVAVEDFLFFSIYEVDWGGTSSSGKNCGGEQKRNPSASRAVMRDAGHREFDGLSRGDTAAGRRDELFPFSGHVLLTPDLR